MRALALLARPRGALLIASLPLVGFGYGLWEVGSTIHPRFVVARMGLLFSSWVLCHAGSLWLNATLDRDQGEVLLGEPVEVPPYAGVAGYLALIGAVGIAGFLGWPTALCSAACATLAVLYSHPKVALKARPFGGPLVNGLGYGALSPIAGWLASDPVLTWRALALQALAVLFLLGVYFSAQAFQADEDGARGYRTLVVTHGPQVTLWVSRVCLAVSAGVAMTLSAVGVLPRGLLASVPFWIWMDRHFARWIAKGDGGTGADATRLVVIVSLAILTMLTAAYAHQAHALIGDLPAGGCATAIVPDALAAVCPQGAQ